MARDCEQLSPKAKKIFKKLKPFFPPDPWKNPQWWEDGRIKNNWDFDLRKAADRKRLEEWYRKLIGEKFVLELSMYRTKNRGRLQGFQSTPRSKGTVQWAKLALILQDLDLQIETLDLCEE